MEENGNVAEDRPEWPRWASCVVCINNFKTDGGKDSSKKTNDLLELEGSQETEIDTTNWDVARKYYSQCEFYLLPCLHFVCSKECLEILQTTTDDGDEPVTSKCAECQKVFSKESVLLQGIFRPLEIIGDVEDEPMVEIPRSCDSCIRDTHAAGSCEICKLLLCSICVETHKVMRLTYTHHLTLNNTKECVPRNQLCSTHPTSRLVMYCSTCDLKLCDKCTSTHTQHSLHNIQSFVQDIKTKLGLASEKAAEISRRCELAEGKLKSHVANLLSSEQSRLFIKAKQQLQKLQDRLMESFKRREQELKQDITKSCVDKATKLRSTRMSLLGARKQASQLSNLISSINTESDVNLILNLSTVLESQFESLELQSTNVLKEIPINMEPPLTIAYSDTALEDAVLTVNSMVILRLEEGQSTPEPSLGQVLLTDPLELEQPMFNEQAAVAGPSFASIPPSPSKFINNKHIKKEPLPPPPEMDTEDVFASNTYFAYLSDDDESSEDSDSDSTSAAFQLDSNSFTNVDEMVSATMAKIKQERIVDDPETVWTPFTTYNIGYQEIPVRSTSPDRLNFDFWKENHNNVSDLLRGKENPQEEIENTHIERTKSKRGRKKGSQQSNAVIKTDTRDKKKGSNLNPQSGEITANTGSADGKKRSGFKNISDVTDTSGIPPLLDKSTAAVEKERSGKAPEVILPNNNNDDELPPPLDPVVRMEFFNCQENLSPPCLDEEGPNVDIQLESQDTERTPAQILPAVEPLINSHEAQVVPDLVSPPVSDIDEQNGLSDMTTATETIAQVRKAPSIKQHREANSVSGLTESEIDMDRIYKEMALMSTTPPPSAASVTVDDQESVTTPEVEEEVDAVGMNETDVVSKLPASPTIAVNGSVSSSSTGSESNARRKSVDVTQETETIPHPIMNTVEKDTCVMPDVDSGTSPDIGGTSQPACSLLFGNSSSQDLEDKGVDMKPPRMISRISRVLPQDMEIPLSGQMGKGNVTKYTQNMPPPPPQMNTIYSHGHVLKHVKGMPSMVPRILRKFYLNSSQRNLQQTRMQGQRPSQTVWTRPQNPQYPLLMYQRFSSPQSSLSQQSPTATIGRLLKEKSEELLKLNHAAAANGLLKLSTLPPPKSKSQSVSVKKNVASASSAPQQDKQSNKFGLAVQKEIQPGVLTILPVAVSALASGLSVKPKRKGGRKRKISSLTPKPADYQSETRKLQKEKPKSNRGRKKAVLNDPSPPRRKKRSDAGTKRNKNRKSQLESKINTESYNGPILNANEGLGKDATKQPIRGKKSVSVFGKMPPLFGTPTSSKNCKNVCNATVESNENGQSTENTLHEEQSVESESTKKETSSMVETPMQNGGSDTDSAPGSRGDSGKRVRKQRQFPGMVDSRQILKRLTESGEVFCSSSSSNPHKRARLLNSQSEESQNDAHEKHSNETIQPQTSLDTSEGSSNKADSMEAEESETNCQTSIGVVHSSDDNNKEEADKPQSERPLSNIEINAPLNPLSPSETKGSTIDENGQVNDSNKLKIVRRLSSPPQASTATERTSSPSPARRISNPIESTSSSVSAHDKLATKIDPTWLQHKYRKPTHEKETVQKAQINEEKTTSNTNTSMTIQTRKTSRCGSVLIPSSTSEISNGSVSLPLASSDSPKKRRGPPGRAPSLKMTVLKSKDLESNISANDQTKKRRGRPPSPKKVVTTMNIPAPIVKLNNKVVKVKKPRGRTASPKVSTGIVEATSELQKGNASKSQVKPNNSPRTRSATPTTSPIRSNSPRTRSATPTKIRSNSPRTRSATPTPQVRPNSPRKRSTTPTLTPSHPANPNPLPSVTQPVQVQATALVTDSPKTKKMLAVRKATTNVEMPLSFSKRQENDNCLTLTNRPRGTLGIQMSQHSNVFTEGLQQPPPQQNKSISPSPDPKSVKVVLDRITIHRSIQARANGESASSSDEIDSKRSPAKRPRASSDDVNNISENLKSTHISESNDVDEALDLSSSDRNEKRPRIEKESSTVSSPPSEKMIQNRQGVITFVGKAQKEMPEITLPASDTVTTHIAAKNPIPTTNLQPKPKERLQERSNSHSLAPLKHHQNGFDEVKKCVICNDDETGPKRFCDSCSTVFHLRCHMPKLSSDAEDNFRCFFCRPVEDTTSTSALNDPCIDWTKMPYGLETNRPLFLKTCKLVSEIFKLPECINLRHSSFQTQMSKTDERNPTEALQRVRRRLIYGKSSKNPPFTTPGDIVTDISKLFECYNKFDQLPDDIRKMKEAFEAQIVHLLSVYMAENS